MQGRSSVATWLILVILAFAILSTCGTGDQTPAATTNPPGFMGDVSTSQAATPIQYFDETIIVNGAMFAPQFTGSLPAELSDGSQWLLVYWWENHEIVGGEGIDWGFFISVTNNQIILLAKCHDPKWPNPTPGQTVYTYYASEALLKVPGNSDLQRFDPEAGVVNPTAPTAVPTSVSTDSSEKEIMGTETKEPLTVFEMLYSLGAFLLLAIALILIGRFLIRKWLNG